MKFFFDTEFTERGADHPIKLISIGMMSETGKPFYMVSSDFKDGECNPWVQQNVLPNLMKRTELFEGPCVAPARSIAIHLEDFVKSCGTPGEKPSFWAYYADYDWVVLCQLFGSMVNLPDGWPKYCRDIKQWVDALGNPKLPKQTGTEHHALNDAEWVRECYAWLVTAHRDPSRLPMLPGCPRLTEGW